MAIAHLVAAHALPGGVGNEELLACFRVSSFQCRIPAGDRIPRVREGLIEGRERGGDRSGFAFPGGVDEFDGIC